MWHPFPGFSGAVTSAAISAVLGVYLRLTKKHKTYNLGPGGNPREYEPIMNRYIRLAEFMIGAASGSIVLVVGSSALHGNGGRLAWFYASPLLLIAASVVYGIGFMACQILTFEDVLHGNPCEIFEEHGGSYAWQPNLVPSSAGNAVIRSQLQNAPAAAANGSTRA